MIHFLKSRALSFRHAYHGWVYLFRTQPNSWIHAAATVLAVSLGLWLGLTTLEWTILILTICSVWVAELLNSAIEAFTDLAMPDHHPLAKKAKDLAAAAVLATAVGSVVVGILLFGPGLVNHLWIVR